MSISRLTASLASVSNELTVAAAALNFDFSLVKIDAPEEFKLVGGTLSAQRRSDAEGGKTHVTARKLGALFDRMIPPIPNLIKAYGHRASVVSSTPAANPQASSRDGAFAAQVGADGTTLWAAATSGRGAIAVHLLACLLARIWSGPEATSLWEEIVDRRRQEIVASFERNEEVDFPTLSIARQEFSRVQLAEWDASARGWLRAADIAKIPELKQLMLIVKNIDACVDRTSDPYEGVIRVWKKALIALENLVNGVPQSSSDGSVLIAIWAWHLYPDLVVTRGANTDVRFADPLIPCGGTLTIGLQMEDDMKRQDGVSWCLSLANLRYYGDPVTSHRAVVPDASRMSFAELAQVALGSVIGQWTGYEDDIFAAAEVFLALWDVISYAAVHETDSRQKEMARQFLKCDSNWMRILVDAARALVESEGVEQQTARQLIKLGQRRAGEFFPTELPPFFGLTNFRTLLSIASSAEARVRFLREIAMERLNGKSNTSIPAIIRYSYEHGGPFEYATALPDLCTSTKRKRDEQSKQSPTFKRWLSSRRPESPAEFPYHVFYSCKVRDWLSRQTHVKALGEDAQDRETAGVLSLDQSHLKIGSHTENFTYVMGDRYLAALFVLQSNQTYFCGQDSRLTNNVVSVRQTTRILRSNSFRIDLLIPLLIGRAVSEEGSSGIRLSWVQVSPFKALSSAARVYKLLSTATISPKVLSTPFHKGRWVPEETGRLPNVTDIADAFGGERLTRAQSFACIALLESGIHNIDPSILSSVIALSSSDSIYVTAPLLCDPWETPRDDEIRRLAGNIGRAGLAMLFAPENVRLRPRDDTRWRVINHAEFDGTPGDNFQSTSLHLSFTGFERSLDTDSAGAKDVSVYLLETRLSLHNEGIWLGDLNVLQSLQSSSLSKLNYPVRCAHTASKALAWPMTSVDNWDEFFDGPKNACIVRVHRNWIARLAFMCICHQLGRRTIILPENICWECSADLSVCTLFFPINSSSPNRKL